MLHVSEHPTRQPVSESPQRNMSLIPRKRSEGRGTPGWHLVETEPSFLARPGHDDGVQERLEAHSGISGRIRLGY